MWCDVYKMYNLYALNPTFHLFVLSCCQKIVVHGYQHNVHSLLSSSRIDWRISITILNLFIFFIFYYLFIFFFVNWDSNIKMKLEKLVISVQQIVISKMLYNMLLESYYLSSSQVGSVSKAYACDARGYEFESRQYQCSCENWRCLKFPWTRNSLLIV